MSRYKLAVSIGGGAGEAVGTFWAANDTGAIAYAISAILNERNDGEWTLDRCDFRDNSLRRIVTANDRTAL